MSMSLKHWLEVTGESQSAFARRLGVGQSLVNRWVRGVRLPSIIQAQAIHRLTGERVGLMDWTKPTSEVR